MKITTMLVIAAAFGLAGCATSGDARVSDSSVVEKIKVGQTKDEVRATLGEPNSTTQLADGQEIWTYVYYKYNTNAATFIPVVGLFAGGGKSSSNSVTITFTKEGAVKGVNKSNNTTTINNG